MNIQINKNDIKIIKLGDKKYPQKLLHIYSPPHVLYVLGNDQILNNKSVAIIGCRQCSNYGRKVSFDLARQFSVKGINVVSGFARGIDTYAHKGVVREKGKTIAVLGCGLDVIYPKENLELYWQIIKYGGAIITEYPLGTRPEKKSFSSKK